MSEHGDDRDEQVVGDELRRLFHSDRLPSGGGPDPEVIVAGARRRRRRRAALSASAGVFVVVGAISAGVALTGLGGPEGGRGDTIAADRSDTSAAPRPTGTAPPASSSPGDAESAPGLPEPPVDGEPSVPPSTVTSPPPMTSDSGTPAAPSSSGESIVTQPLDAPGSAVLTHIGKYPLRLGMGYAAAVETGAMDEGTGPPEQGSCKSYAVSDPAISRVAIRGGQGIVRFQADTARTPDGIRVGSSMEELRAAYPDLEQAGENSYVKQNPDSSSRYVFGIANGSVSTLRLTVPSPAATC